MNPDNIKITLENSEGKPVTIAYIMPFDTLPDVVSWGIRVFRHFEAKTYRECFYAPCHSEDDPMSLAPKTILQAYESPQKTE